MRTETDRDEFGLPIKQYRGKEKQPANFNFLNPRNLGKQSNIDPPQPPSSSSSDSDVASAPNDTEALVEMLNGIKIDSEYDEEEEDDEDMIKRDEDVRSASWIQDSSYSQRVQQPKPSTQRPSNLPDAFRTVDRNR